MLILPLNNGMAVRGILPGLGGSQLLLPDLLLTGLNVQLLPAQ